MGDALAVEIAQQSHLNLLRLRAGCMVPEECLQYRCPIPRGPFYELLTIDDHIRLQKVKKSGDWSLSLHCNRDEQVNGVNHMPQFRAPRTMAVVAMFQPQEQGSCC